MVSRPFILPHRRISVASSNEVRFKLEVSKIYRGDTIISLTCFPDFTKGNGSGGESIYGGTFADEDLTHPLDAPG